MRRRNFKSEAVAVANIFRNDGESQLEGLLRGYKAAGGSPRMVARLEREIAAAKARGNPHAQPMPKK